MKCATCSSTMDLFERACAVVRALPPEDFAKLKAALLVRALRDQTPARTKFSNDPAAEPWEREAT